MFVNFCRALIAFCFLGCVYTIILHGDDFNRDNIKAFFFYDGYSPPAVHVGEKRRDEHKAEKRLSEYKDVKSRSR